MQLPYMIDDSNDHVQESEVTIKNVQPMKKAQIKKAIKNQAKSIKMAK